jgi:diguanylate cyclase (GGDEF)-like protein
MLDPKGGSTAAPVPVAAPDKALAAALAMDARLVYLVDDDALAQQHIASQLESFGYEVVVMTGLDGLAGAIVARAPSAIIIDMGFLQRGQYGAADIVRMQQLPMQSIPVIFTSNSAGFVSRLAAIRAGARGYFVKPVDVVALIDRLDVVTTREQKQPCRILIVDDDASVSECHASILRGARMEVRLLHEPSGILQALAEFRPELVVMDVHMPGCNGVELTKMMRQDSLLLDIPIVFLSTESNLDRQLEAIQAGADDFLTKPISSEHLISSLTSRIERYRLLRDLIVRDGLTGLYKHATLKEHLAREFARAKRSHTPLALAMIDLDFFKNVNDHYGHPAGDQVLRTLSRLLQQRLRRVDIIGRYGGEEFSVIFPDTEVKVAVAVLERVREAFAKIRHHTDTGVFTVTFSAGVVGLDQQPDPQALLGAADAQLYEAKGKGRNRVEYVA